MEVPRHWRMRKQRYQLQGEVCSKCDAKVFPSRPVCPQCGHGLIQEHEMAQMPVTAKTRVSINR